MRRSWAQRSSCSSTRSTSPTSKSGTGAGTASLFTDDAISVIHKQSRGLPRAVNNICRLGLIASLATGNELIDIAAANQAAKEYSAE